MLNTSVGNNCRELLRHFSKTDGLIRGTGLLSLVVVNGAFALLPGFGVYGLLISNTIQFFCNAILEIPFGIFADRFGWAKSVIIAQGMKCLVPVMDMLAVYSAWRGQKELAWTFIALDAIIDAFVFSLHNGAYQAAYSEWYRITVKKFGDVTEAPPLFIKSLRYSLWIRLLIPLSIIGLILLIQSLSFGITFTAYSATYVALSIVAILRLIVFARVTLDLRAVHAEEKKRLSSYQGSSAFKTFVEVLTPIRVHFSAFVLFTIATFQQSLSGAFMAGLGMQQMNKLLFPQPYRWLASIGLILIVFVADSLFWMAWGHRLNKTNASNWIRNLGLSLLCCCLVVASLHLLGANPLIQSFGFAVCVLFGCLCSGAITRYVTSYMRDWLQSELVATWISVANCLSLLALGTMGWALVAFDRFVPSIAGLLTVSILIALSTIYYLSCGIQSVEQESRSLKTLLSNTSLSVAIIFGSVMATILIYFSVVSIVDQHLVMERSFINRMTIAIRENRPFVDYDQGSESQLVACFESKGNYVGESPPRCEKNTQHVLASTEYRLATGSGEIIVRIDRTKLVLAAVKPFAVIILLFALTVFILHRMLVFLTKDIHGELNNIFESASKRNKRGDCFSISEFKQISEQLCNLHDTQNELVRHKAIADLSARVAHDIQSPLTVFKLISPQMSHLPERPRELYEHALQRVFEISNDLLRADKHRDSRNTDQCNSTNLISFTPGIIEEIITEKRTCFDSDNKNLIEFELDASAYDTFVCADPTLMKCVVSNILQNAWEATGRNGRIRVQMHASQQSVFIVIEDNGKGIPPNILKKLKIEKTTYGKPNGNGLGIFNANNAMTSWGGNLDIDSEEGIGTKIQLTLNRVGAPEWFLSRLMIQPNAEIVIVDDEQSIHKVWRRRFEFLRQGGTGFKLFHFTSSQTFLDWFRAQKKDESRIYLIDEDLNGSEMNGLDVISKIGDSGHLILVTASSENEFIRRKCIERKVKLVPKWMAASIPIHLDKEEKVLPTVDPITSA